MDFLDGLCRDVQIEHRSLLLIDFRWEYLFMLLRTLDLQPVWRIHAAGMAVLQSLAMVTLVRRKDDRVAPYLRYLLIVLG